MCVTPTEAPAQGPLGGQLFYTTKSQQRNVSVLTGFYNKPPSKSRCSSPPSSSRSQQSPRCRGQMLRVLRSIRFSIIGHRGIGAMSLSGTYVMSPASIIVLVGPKRGVFNVHPTTPPNCSTPAQIWTQHLWKRVATRRTTNYHHGTCCVLTKGLRMNQFP